MKPSAVTLTLCFSLALHSHLVQAADTGLTRQPWADRTDLAPAQRPLQPQPAAGLENFSTAYSREEAWMEAAVERYLQHAPESAEATIDYSMQVFISEGMPEGALRHLFKQALDEPPGQVRFVLQGFEPQKLGALIGRLRRLFPDPQGDDILIEIDPEAFRTYQVDSVPVFLVKDGEEWYEVQGTISLEGARENVRRRGPLVVGELYAIAEPDMLTVIEERVRDYDWTAALQRAQSRVADNLSPKFDLPTVTRHSEDFFTPVFIVPHDIVIPEYNENPEVLLARAGTRYNILDFTSLQVPIIVFDASDPRQRRLVKEWIAGEYADADLFVVGAESADGRPGTVALSEQLQRPTYPWFGRMSDRFGVRAVPAIVEQAGDRLRIRYVEPPSFTP